MNVILQLFQKYAYENKFTFGVIVVFSLIINFLQTKVIAETTASIFESIRKNDINIVFSHIYYFMWITVFYILITFADDFFEIQISTQLVQWMRREMLNFIIMSNNEEFTNVDTMKYHSPINRVSYGAVIFLNLFMKSILPNLSFVAIIIGYFMYTNLELGVTFFISNLIVFAYAYYTQDTILQYKIDYENTSNENENYTLDIFNNFDKIISRGQSNSEMDKYKEQSDIAIEKSKLFFEQSHINNSIMTSFVYLVILGCLYYLVMLKRDDKIKTPVFISLFTVMLMYRDRFTVLLGSIPSLIEMNGRIEYATDLMKDLKHDLYAKMPDSNYETRVMKFDRIEFNHVYYKYKTSERYLLEDLNLEIVPRNNIIGITGLSGRGKSTVMKLMLRLYAIEKGDILIDGIDIKTIDPIYLRQNITYINQSGRLFNMKIMENIMYGCISEPECKQYLDIIMKYPKIKRLYANVDLVNGKSGFLGEGLSGGQRQVINIISGLINPSPILVLDEPTNALDAELKSEIISIIDQFREYKKCIIIITHDRDVYPLFDQRINL